MAMKPMSWSKRDLDCHRAYQELMAIADEDIRDTHGESHISIKASAATLSLYGDVVRQAEAQADAEVQPWST